MKRLIFLLFLLSVSIVFGQNRVSKVTYQCTTHLYNGNVLAGKTVLYFSDTTSLYMHKDYPKYDSYGGESITGNAHIISFAKGDIEGLPVYFDLKKRMLIYKTEYISNPIVPFFILEEPLPAINWQIHKERKLIAGLQAVFATGEFGNRMYEVWFCPDIPVSFGPYKLWGLPGLILDAKSLDGKVAFQFVSWDEATDDAILIAPPKLGKKVTQEQLRKYIIKKLLRVESRGNGNGDTNVDPPADYTIEKRKFTYISEYNRLRGARW